MTDPSEQASEQQHHDLGTGGRPRSMSVRDVLGPSSPSALRRAVRSVSARPAAAVRVAAGVAGLGMIALTYLLVADAVVGSPSAFGEEPAGVVQSNAVLTRAEPWADRLSAPAPSPGAGIVTSAMASPDVPASGSAATVPALTGAAATAPVSPGAPPATITSATVPPPPVTAAAVQAAPQPDPPAPAPTAVFDDNGGGHGSDDGDGEDDDDGGDDSGGDRDDREAGDDHD